MRDIVEKTQGIDTVSQNSLLRNGAESMRRLNGTCIRSGLVPKSLGAGAAGSWITGRFYTQNNYVSAPNSSPGTARHHLQGALNEAIYESNHQPTDP